MSPRLLSYALLTCLPALKLFFSSYGLRGFFPASAPAFLSSFQSEGVLEPLHAPFFWRFLGIWEGLLRGSCCLKGCVCFWLRGAPGAKKKVRQKNLTFVVFRLCAAGCSTVRPNKLARRNRPDLVKLFKTKQPLGRREPEESCLSNRGQGLPGTTTKLSQTYPTFIARKLSYRSSQNSELF